MPLLILVALWLGSFTSYADSGNVFQILAGDQKPFFLDGSIYTMFNHSTAKWDADQTTREGVLALLDWSHKAHIPTLMTVDISATTHAFLRNKYFLDSRSVDYTIQSEAGATDLILPNISTLILAGGNLSMCLCEFMRDAVRNAGFRNGELNILIVEEATYDFRDYVVRGIKNWSGSIKDNDSLINYFANVKPLSLWGYFRSDLLDDMHSFCPHQNYSKFGTLNPKDYRIRFIVNGKIISDEGKSDKIINLSLVKLASLQAVVESDPRQFFAKVQEAERNNSSPVIEEGLYENHTASQSIVFRKGELGFAVENSKL